MPCKLARQPGGTFKARVGARITVDVRSDQPAETVHIFYAGEQDGEAPFEFVVQRGAFPLLLAAVGVEQDQRMLVVEDDGTEQGCPVKRFSWSRAHFHTTLVIEGV